MALPWKKLGDFMLFRRLDACAHEVLTLAYRFTDKPEDPWTTRVNSFKDGDHASVNAACRVMKRALQSLPSLGKLGTVVGAISSSKETLEQSDPVWKLGKAVAAALEWQWSPDLLSKKTHSSLHKLRTAAKRDETVSGVYKAKSTPTAVVLVVDDFVTRGATLCDIFRALSKATPRVKVKGLALAKTENANFEANIGISNEHVPAHLATELTPLSSINLSYF